MLANAYFRQLLRKALGGERGAHRDLLEQLELLRRTGSASVRPDCDTALGPGFAYRRLVRQEGDYSPGFGEHCSGNKQKSSSSSNMRLSFLSAQRSKRNARFQTLPAHHDEF